MQFKNNVADIIYNIIYILHMNCVFLGIFQMLGTA